MLNSLMATLIKDELKQVAICHSIVQAARPKSVISPMLFGVGVQLDHLYRSKWLVNELARLGFSISYDEVIRYKESVSEASKGHTHTQSFPNAFTEWVADNVDPNVMILDGLGSFLGMGIIAISTRSSKTVDHIQEERVVRLKRALVENVTKSSGVPIKLVCPTEKPGLSNWSSKARKHLQFSYILPPSSINGSGSVVDQWLAHTRRKLYPIKLVRVHAACK